MYPLAFTNELPSHSLYMTSVFSFPIWVLDGCPRPLQHAVRAMLATHSKAQHIRSLCINQLSIAQQGTAGHSTAQHSRVHHSTAQRSAAQQTNAHRVCCSSGTAPCGARSFLQAMTSCQKALSWQTLLIEVKAEGGKATALETPSVDPLVHVIAKQQIKTLLMLQ